MTEHLATLPRATAMVRRCKRHGGDCPCDIHCLAESQLCCIQSDLKRELAEVERRLAWLRRRPCTVRDDWQRPEKPEGDYTLSVVNEGDGWCLHWYSETEKVDYIAITGDATWPFVEDTAWPDDWERLGIEVQS